MTLFEVLMKQTTFSRFEIDNSSILYLSLIRKDHTNTYRFTMTLTEPVCPDTLQKAVDRIYRRFPTIIAGFHPGAFRYTQVPAQSAPQVQKDPGCLITITREEIKNCAFRVYYQENTVAIEAFHALADGYGAVACFTTLVAEYLRLKYNIPIPVAETLVDLDQSPAIAELTDAYLEYEQGKPLHLPSRYAYQLPGGNSVRDTIYPHNIQLPTDTLLAACRARGVSITALIGTVMAASIMEVQKLQNSSGKIRPVRIMVPVDLRRMFPSRTFRNFILYALPTMEPEDADMPLTELMRSFSRQMHSQVQPEKPASIMAYNVRTQGSWYFKAIPLSLKCAAMRLAYRYFGESNSSITMTNLGNVRLPKEMQGYVTHMDVTLTPRVRSPYNCGILSFGGNITICISRFNKDSQLEAIFRRNLESLLTGETL